ncbi:MAG: sulfatase-like hydrolase/transferase, partial [Vitreimonas sp.]
MSSTERFEVRPDASVHFAWLRTQIALQRTLMAAVRTAVSLIGFGFTVAQFFEHMPGLSHVRAEMPRNLGLVLIAAGAISLAVFTWQYHVASVYLRSGEFAQIAGTGGRTMHSAAYIVAFAVMAIGIVAFRALLSADGVGACAAHGGIAHAFWTLDRANLRRASACRGARTMAAKKDGQSGGQKALKEYAAGQAFNGVIGRTFDVSEPSWPAPQRAKEGAPNVLFIVIDDTGFGHLSCYGGGIDTPNLDALAKDGLRYSNMHTTALCSPSRSCMITGRNHHSNAMSGITEISTGFPGSNGIIPFENGFLSEILQQQGYNTYAIGKWHLTPTEQTSAAGPYDRWPLGRGFERYYGFLGGDTHQYYPELVRDNSQTEPEKTPEEGYHL